MVHTFLFRRVLPIALVVLATGSVAVGQRPQAGPVTVLVDFNATTADGKPFTDLTPADVTIRVGGKQRTIQSLTFKQVESGAAAPAAAGAAAPAPAAGALPPFATNEPKAASASGSGGGAGGRMIQLLIDAESLRPGTEQAIREHAEKLFAGLGAADRVAFSITPRDTAQVPFGPVSAARAALAKFIGQRGGDAICRTADTLKFIRAILEPHAGVETPMSVIFIAGSLSTAGSSKSQTGGTCTVLQDDYRVLAAAAASARANVYVVQGDPGESGRDNGLENLAGTTGAGTVMRVVNEGFAPRVLTESSSYWVATLVPDPSDRPGPPQRLEIKVAKEGVAVRARNEVGIGTRSAAAAATPAKPGPTTPRDMVRAAANQTFTDLQLRASVYTARGQADKMTALVFTEPVDPANKIAALSIGFFDQNGQGGTVPAKDDQLKAATVSMPLQLNAGQYRIRVAATDATGKAGAVDINVNTALTTAGPFKMSSMMSGAETEAGRVPRMIFSNEEKIWVMFEMYGIPSADAKMRVGFEIVVPDAPKPQTFRPIGMLPTNEPDKHQMGNLRPAGEDLVMGAPFADPEWHP